MQVQGPWEEDSSGSPFGAGPWLVPPEEALDGAAGAGWWWGQS